MKSDTKLEVFMFRLLSYVMLILIFNMLSGCQLASKNKKSYLLDEHLSQFENIYPYGQAKYVNGEVHLQSTKNWFYTTKKTYQDFILTVDVMMPKVDEYSNSGIIFRGQIIKNNNEKYIVGYQAEIDPSARKWTGGLFDQGRRKWLHPLHPKRSNRDADFIKTYLNEWEDKHANAYNHLAWNTISIECIGNDIKIFVNNILTTHVIDTKDTKGVIGLQHHGSKELIKTGKTDNIIRFKNMVITELN